MAHEGTMYLPACTAWLEFQNSLEQPADPEAGASWVGNLIHQRWSDQEVQQIVDSQAFWVAYSLPSMVTDRGAGPPFARPHFPLPSGTPA